MLGKDYMLAIIIVNYDDNIWADQGVVVDPDLPSGWRIIRDSTGLYYWHVPTGATQWHHPCHDGLSPETSANQEISSRRHSSTEAESDPKGSTELRSCWHGDAPGDQEPDTKCFAVRSLGWLEVPEEELSPGRSSLAVNNIIQQLSHCKSTEQTDGQGAWGEGQEMLLVLKKDTLSLMDPLDHTLLHSQPIISIRVWGVGCNNGRDFAFVAGEKDSCVFKCHVFRCDAPARTIATTLHDMCSKILSEKLSVKPPRSVTIDSMSPEDLPRQVEFLEAMRQQIPNFEVQYIGTLPVARAMGMEVLNRAIESIMNATDRDDWEPIRLHVSDNVLSLWRGQDGQERLWEVQVRSLTFLGVGHDTRTFALIVDGGAQRFLCHVFWCEPDAGGVSEAVQAACMLQYQKCLVAQTPPPRTKLWRGTPSRVKRANSMDNSAFLSPPSCYHGNGATKGNSGGATNNSVKKGMLAFFETFRNKQAATN